MNEALFRSFMHLHVIAAVFNEATAKRNNNKKYILKPQEGNNGLVESCFDLTLT